MTAPRTVVLADDHVPTRYGVRLSLENGGFTVCAEAGTADAAVAGAVAYRPDVALLDINMPGSGIVAAERIAAEVPETAIVMLTASRADDDLFSALQAGAMGYLLKETDPERLPLALAGVLDGEAALPRTLVTRLIREYQGRARRRRIPRLGSRGATLTEREWEVLEALDSGLTTKEIAARLEVSPVTVRRHISIVLQKLGVASREEALQLLAEGR